uniref:Transthyretin-like family protein n=1 Tax=Panagrellus redivivus TaxID=6233 RepID=A0A7E4V5B2_PANRE
MKAVVLVLFTLLCFTPVAIFRNQTWYYKVVAKILCNGMPVNHGVDLIFSLGSKTVNTVGSLSDYGGDFVHYSDSIEYQVPSVPDLKVQLILPTCTSCKEYARIDRNFVNFLFLEPKYAEQYPLNVSNVEILNICKK